MTASTPLSRLILSRQEQVQQNNNNNTSITIINQLEKWNTLLSSTTLNNSTTGKVNNLTSYEALQLGDEQWMEILNIDYIEACKFGNWLGQTLCPKIISVQDMMVTRSIHSTTINTIQTGLPLLDTNLRGGLPIGQITELVGEAGVGKTQFCLTLTARVVTKLGYGVLYIDTEGKFSVHRLMEIVSELDGNEDCIQHIIVLRADTFNTATLLTELQNLDSQIIEHHVKLIILDSIAATSRLEFNRDQIFERQQALSKQASVLKMFAETYQLAVLLTNQVIGGNDNSTSTTTNNNSLQPFDVSKLVSDRTNNNSNSVSLFAALGNTWAHCVNVRLALEKTTTDYETTKRHIRVVKSPLCLETIIPYDINVGGIVSL
jgi:RAD51-like protein 1